MDYRSLSRVGELVSALTDAKAGPELSDPELRQLKALLRGSDALVDHALAVLTERLGANHAQTRRLAVELADVLFSRSRRFREGLAAQMTAFVEQAVGHRHDRPLPPPAAAARALRERALEAIQCWHELWGVHYPQVTLAYRFLRRQAFAFPEISSRAAAVAAAEAARRARHQAALLDRFHALAGGDFAEQRRELEALARAMQGCVELLRQPVQTRPEGAAGGGTGPGPGAAGAAEAAAEAAAAPGAATEDSGSGGGGDREEWEDVAPPHGPPASCAASGEAADPAGGAAETDDEEWVGEFPQPEVPDPDHAARAATVREQLEDLARQAQLAASKQLLEWLRLLTQLQLRDDQQQLVQQRQQLLRAVVDLRIKLQAQLDDAASVGVGVRPAQGRQADEAQGGRRGPPALAATEQSGGDGGDGRASAGGAGNEAQTAAAAGASGALSGLPCRSQQPLQLLPQHAGSRRWSGSGDAPGGPAGGAPAIAIGCGLRRHLAEAAGKAGAAPGEQQHLATAGSWHAAAETLATPPAPQQAGARPASSPRSPTAPASPVELQGRRRRAGSEQQQQQQQQQQQEQQPHQPQHRPQQPQQPPINPYASLRDPAAAVAGAYTITQELVRQREQQLWRQPSDDGDSSEGAAAAEAPHAAAAGCPPPPAAGGNGDADSGGAAAASGAPSSIDPQLRRRLLAAAPKLPVSGEAWRMAQHGVVSHGMELYNHWGAVDATAEIPQDRLGQLVGLAASFYRPSKKQPAKAAAPLEAGGGPAAPAAGAAAAAVAAAPSGVPSARARCPPAAVSPSGGARSLPPRTTAPCSPARSPMPGWRPRCSGRSCWSRLQRRRQRRGAPAPAAAARGRRGGAAGAGARRRSARATGCAESCSDSASGSGGTRTPVGECTSPWLTTRGARRVNG